MDEILRCDHSKKTSSGVLSHGAIFLACSSYFCVCGWNPTVWPFKENLFRSTFTWCHFFSVQFLLLRPWMKSYGVTIQTSWAVLSLVLLNHILTSSTFPAKGFNSPAGFSGLTSTCGGYPPSVVSVNLVFKDGLVHSKQSWPSFSHHSTALQLGFDLRHKAMHASDDVTFSAKGFDKPFVLEHQYGV